MLFRVVAGLTILIIIALFVWLYFSSSQLVAEEDAAQSINDAVTTEQVAEETLQQAEELASAPEESDGEGVDAQEAGDAPEEAEATNAEESTTSSQEVGDITRNVDLISWGFSTTGREEIDTIIIHSVYDKAGSDPYDLNSILAIFESYDVSAHYIVERDGTITQLVAEKHVSWHAGSGTMEDGRTNINAFSIGIEVITSENEGPTAAQYAALKYLVDDISARRPIAHVTGHSDIAPSRKTDPWQFDWRRIGGKKE